jgi:hypothetical protein
MADRDLQETPSGALTFPAPLGFSAAAPASPVPTFVNFSALLGQVQADAVVSSF